jgi:hypothetical protein
MSEGEGVRDLRSYQGLICGHYESHAGLVEGDANYSSSEGFQGCNKIGAHSL